MTNKDKKLCPCGLTNSYSNCCGTFINNLRQALTPEELMRSRYTAYTMANIPYIKRTMRPPAANNFDATAARKWAKQVTWLKLEVIGTYQEGLTGFVKFKAHYLQKNKKCVLHEISEFHYNHGQWFYVDGKLL
ncbi:MAG: hypothetical protein A3E83_09030 [Gammaproteobacteria bacterium RIFCSPHIGHO2_12_FULL_41_20]|nr:MAG: hypothetical protein A3E83_09030 [Gammaproteobacteria bacterium RIFCSPHIGHO2_12_FULL_41_20]